MTIPLARFASLLRLDNLTPEAKNLVDALDTFEPGSVKQLDAFQKFGEAYRNANRVDYPRVSSAGVGVSKSVLGKGDRLKLFGKALSDAPGAKNADDALKLINRTMDKIEDAYSGVAAKANPGLKYEGRMYGPRSDYTKRLSNGGLEAITAGNIIRISPNGGIQFFLKNSNGSAGKMVFNKAGG